MATGNPIPHARGATPADRSRRDLLARLALLGAAPLVTSACSTAATNFSQYPGFAAFFAAHPRRDQPADAAEQALLLRHRPRFHLAPGQTGPLDFYRDYIAHGQLVDGQGRLVSTQVTQALLNAHREDPRAVFTHYAPAAAPAGRAAVYGRVDRDRLQVGGQVHDFIFLTYHAVFRQSGLAAGLGGWRAAVLSLLGDLDDWHQLDHYTAATVVLHGGTRPVALMLQQHNYHHTLVFDAKRPWPADGRVGVDVALRSNELYPHAPQRTPHRAVRFNSPEELRYLMGLGDKPWVASEDITEGTTEIEHELQFLAPSDAFYSFQGFLGERRRLPGRDGPPGADYNALPAHKALCDQMLMGFWRAGNREDLARLDAGYGKTGRPGDFIAAQALPFLAAIGVAA